QMPFWDRSLDIVVATHADADHVSGLPPLLARYEVGELWVAETESDSAVYQAVLDTAVERNIPVYRPQAGETLLIEDGVRLEILHPAPNPASDDRNDNSVSFRLVYDNFSLLLTGDAEEAGEREMLESGQPVQALVFKAGHHGAKNASNDFFLAAVQPQVVVVSAGAENRFGHPHPEMLERATAVGATVLRTDELGTITLETDGQHIWWWAEKRP
ncbi:MAG: MBL fold metallo-hydrolase, partial [Anaerolineales bacterium]|nr:MBL fold metallo-hydrolase [Anaerolineales bacterium]